MLTDPAVSGPEWSKLAVSGLYFLVLSGTVIAALPVAVFFLETVSALALPRKTPSRELDDVIRERVGVLIPAHNEEKLLPAAIASIRPQLRSGDNLLVVADNCTDNTASVAENLGADVVVRMDECKKGKGFALECGIRRFAGDPPKIVVVVDADCKLSEFAIDRLAATCSRTNRPAQALDLMVGSTPGAGASEFAWRVRNWIRPLGLSSAGLPCQLMGTGMAFPWEVIAAANLSTDALAEDLQLGLELTAHGHPPIFCPSAVVTSEFPASDEERRSQKHRWRRGHIAVMTGVVPRFILTAIGKGNLRLLVLCLDAAVPPLALLWTIIIVNFLLSLFTFRMGAGPAPLVISAANIFGFVASAGLCWLWGVKTSYRRPGFC
ncbi:MAG TPA: glycosyltransferase family 2 protein [Elusimicrobiota bacterium]|nr:glycosyltransferase family 2 protein [Elusimicrobiota bacterium]